MVKGTVGAVAFAVATSVFGSVVTGTGEYRFGPETAQNIACLIAEENAKKNAIANFVGEYIEHQTNQICKNEECTEYRTLFSEISGNVQTIIDRTVLVAPERGHSVCIVDIKAQVEKISNPITFKVEGSSELRHGDRFVLSGISNRVGKYWIFNVVDDTYQTIHSGKISLANKEFVIPSTNQRLLAKVPTGKHQSKEKIVVLFSTEALTIQSRYSRIEFERLINDISFVNRKLVNHHLTIVR
jgi:hypothetical protein